VYQFNVPPLAVAVKAVAVAFWQYDIVLVVVGAAVRQTFIVIVLDDGQPLLFVIAHFSTFAPLLKPVTVVVGEDELVNVPVPLTTDQAPVPEDGGVAASCVVSTLIDWLIPALAPVVSSTVIAIVSLGPSQPLSV